MSESSDRPDGKRIKAAREAKGWTQQKLADLTGYKLSVIQKVEAGGYFGLPCLEACVEALGEAYTQATPRPREIHGTEHGKEAAPSDAPLPGTPEFYLQAIAGRWAGTSFVHAGEGQQGHEVPPQEFEWDVVVQRSGTSLSGEGTCRTAGYEHGQYSLRGSINGLGLVMLDGVRGVGDGANNLFRALLKYHSDGRARTMEGGFVVNWAQHESIFLGWLKLRRVDASPSQGRAKLP
jgi:transcriptional regulator with XRE-family HTH domain